ncbi:MAG: hypothetical protein AAGF74_01805 [Pseudomonadota bacterium]
MALRICVFVCLFATPLAAQDALCPPAPDISAEAEPIYRALKDAPDEASARTLSNDLWALWTIAPDQLAQELLNEGMDRRAAYDFEGAMIAFDTLTDYCPAYAEGYNQRAFVHYLRQDFGSALEDLDRVLALSPQHIGALSGRALTLMGLGRMEEGQAALRGALALNPWLPERGLLMGTPEIDL